MLFKDVEGDELELARMSGLRLISIYAKVDQDEETLLLFTPAMARKITRELTALTEGLDRA